MSDETEDPRPRFEMPRVTVDADGAFESGPEVFCAHVVRCEATVPTKRGHCQETVASVYGANPEEVLARAHFIADACNGTALEAKDEAADFATRTLGDALGWARQFSIDPPERTEPRLDAPLERAAATAADRIRELIEQVAEQALELMETQGERDHDRLVLQRIREFRFKWFETAKRRTREWRAEKARAERAEARVAELEGHLRGGLDPK